MRDSLPERTIRIETSDVAALEAEWEQRMGRPPDAELLATLVDRRVDEELLLQDAYELGWQRTDAIVQRRLLQNQRFLTPESEIDDAELLERAYEQGMDRSDIVVRRRLLERIRLLVASGARTPTPTDDELAGWLASHPDDFERPLRVRVSHVYLSRDRRGDALVADAEALARQLREEKRAPDLSGELGDPFLIPSRLPLWSEAQLARQLGASFAAGAMQAPIGRWSDPIASSYGLHIVWAHVRAEREMPTLDEVRVRVEAALLRDREQAAMRAHLARLREEAEIEIADLKTILEPAREPED